MQYLFDEICRVIIEFGKFRLALIGLMNEEPNKIELSAYNGESNDFAELLIKDANNKNEVNPILKAIKNNSYIIINNYKGLEGSDLLKMESLKRGFSSSIAVPLHTNKKIIGILCIYSQENNFFDEDEKKLVNEIASDISYALDKIEIEKNQRAIEKKIRKNERLLSTLMNNLPGIAYRCKYNKNWTMEFISAGCKKLTGYDPEEIIGDKVISYNDLIQPEDRQRVADTINKAIVEKQNFTIEYRILTKEEKLKWVWEKGTGIYDDQGNLETLEGFVNEITERKMAEKEMLISKVKAESANKMKSEFLAQVSHEIRTPINTITSFCGFLEDTLKDNGNKDTKESFKIINSAAIRMIRTIDLILNMSEIQTGSYEPLLKKLNIHNLLQNLLPEFKSSAKRKGLNIGIKNLSDNCITEVDEYSVSQVFANLIDNAIKYTPKGNVEIEISNCDKSVLVTIKDTGIGISKDYLPVLFNPFSQEEGGYTRKFEGNGLGLALVKKYCEINNAEISVESEKGKGTKFTIKLNSFRPNP
ncbi:MAG: ATP-binding protein [Ignavibacteria bacterium]|jgi:PAS domain S-box-containing protein